MPNKFRFPSKKETLCVFIIGTLATNISSDGVLMGYHHHQDHTEVRSIMQEYNSFENPANSGSGQEGYLGQ